MLTENGKQRKLDSLAKARTASMFARRHPTSATLVRRELKGPRKLRAKHFDIARRKVLGQTNLEIARELGLSQDMVNVITRAPIFVDYLAQLEKQINTKFVTDAALSPVRARIETEQLPSVEALCRLRDDAVKEDVQFKAARTLIEAGGNMKVSDEGKGTAPLSNDVAHTIAVSLKEVKLYIESRKKA